MNYDDEGLEEYPSEGEREMEKKKVWGKEIEKERKGNSERERLQYYNFSHFATTLSSLPCEI